MGNHTVLVHYTTRTHHTSLTHVNLKLYIKNYCELKDLKWGTATAHYDEFCSVPNEIKGFVGFFFGTTLIFFRCLVFLELNVPLCLVDLMGMD